MHLQGVGEHDKNYNCSLANGRGDGWEIWKLLEPRENVFGWVKYIVKRCFQQHGLQRSSSL